MHGAGSGVLKELLGEDVVVEINGERNPLFGGQAPEPVESKMQLLSQTVVSKSCDLGIANDGDADRIAMVDEKGEFVSSHKILSLLLEYLRSEHTTELQSRGHIVCSLLLEKKKIIE